TTIEFELVTSLFVGGAHSRADEGSQQSLEDRLRVRPIVGHLRYWFRALMGGAVVSDLKNLQRLEAAAFGTAAGSEHGGRGASWRMWLSQLDQCTTIPFEGVGREIAYVGYGLQRTKDAISRRAIIPQGSTGPPFRFAVHLMGNSETIE